jgi:hypothetical protein
MFMDIIKHFWYLIHVERQKETVTVYALTSQMTPMKTIRTMLVSVILMLFALIIKDEVLLTVSSPIFPSILIAKNLLTGV